MCFFLEELCEHRPQLRPYLTGTLLVLGWFAVGGKDEKVIASQSQHGHTDDEHDEHPRLGHTVTLDEYSRQIHQSTRGKYLRHVVEGTLPTYPACLFFGRKYRHIRSIGCNVVCGTAHGNHGQNANGDGKEVGEVQGESQQSKHQATKQLGKHHKKLLGLVDFKEWTPNGLQRPRQHNQSCPKGDLRVRDTHAFVH